MTITITQFAVGSILRAFVAKFSKVRNGGSFVCYGLTSLFQRSETFNGMRRFRYILCIVYTIINCHLLGEARAGPHVFAAG